MTIQDLEISDSFQWRWVGFNYNRIKAKAKIEIQFRELKHWHQRTFEFDLPRTVNTIETSDIYQMISTLPWYDDTKEVDIDE